MALGIQGTGAPFNMHIVRINEFIAAPGQSEALRDFLGAVIELVEGSPGCEDCELLCDPEDAAHLAIIETWTSIASHQAAAAAIAPEKLAELRPLLAQPPTGRYYEPVR
jgi:quinol monooxygenase YgiN